MDPWGTNAWSAEENDSEENPNSQLPLKWQRHMANDHSSRSAIDVNLPPSWSTMSSSVWDTGNDIWTPAGNTASDEPSYAQIWKAGESKLPSHTITKPPEERPSFRPALPTPPSSPAISVSLPGEEDLRIASSNSITASESLGTLETLDPFGSFESAQETPSFSSTLSSGENFACVIGRSPEETWKPSWDSPVDAPSTIKWQTKDDWDVASVQRKFSEGPSRERLRSIISQWKVIAQQNDDLSEEYDYSWKKGLDNIVGLLERLDGLILQSHLALPTSFPQSKIAEAVTETLRLTLFFSLSQSSPMAQFYTTKSSSEWEKSVKTQTLAAKDEWGWDFKQAKEDPPEPLEPMREPERKSGFLSFWKRRTPSDGAVTVAVTTIKSQTEIGEPQVQPQTTPPALTPSIRSSLESPPLASAPFGALVLEPNIDISAASDVDSLQVQPSVVTRFLNRLSRRPLSGTIETSEEFSSSQVTLSEDDLAFLSDVESKPTVPLKSFQEIIPPSTLTKPETKHSPLSKLPPSSPPSSRITRVTNLSDVADLLSDASTGSSAVNRSLTNSLFEDISLLQDKTLPLPRQQPLAAPNLLSAPFPLSFSILPAPSSQYSHLSSPPLSSLDHDDSVFGDPSYLKDDDGGDFGDFGDFVSTPHSLGLEHPEHVRQSLSKAETHIRHVDPRTSLSVITPMIIKPSQKFTANHFQTDGNLRTENRLRSPGKFMSLPPPPKQRTSVAPTSTASAIASSLRVSTLKPETTPNVKSGLSAQDLSFFEGL